MITAAGVGSGLDLESIINQLVALERRPLELLQSNKLDFQAQLSAVGQLQSGISSFQTALSSLNTTSSFEVYKTDVADSQVFTASASSAAAPGNFDIQVVNLAEAHKLGSTAQPDKNTTTFGAAGDQLTITIGTGSFIVDTGGKTLEQIRDAINDATDNVGASASIIQESDTSFRLLLTSDQTGTANAMTLAFTDSGGGPVADPLGLTTTNAAEDASLLVDGTYSVTRSSNTITDAIDGVTLNLLAESTTAVNMKVSRDNTAVSSSVQAFVDAFNTMHATFDDLRAGDLQGDSTLRQVENQILNILNTPPTGLSGGFSYLSELGIAIEKDGTMSLDQGKLDTALDTDFAAVSELFANDNQGYIFRIDALLDSYLDTDSVLDSRTDGLNARIESIDDRIDNEEFRLGLREETLRAQFTALDSLVGQLQSTSAFLNQQLNQF